MMPRAAVPLFLSLLATACGTGSRVDRSGPTTPYGRSAHPIPGLIEAEHYDEGAPGAAYLDSDEVNRGADYRGVTQVDIERRPDASNGHGIGWTRAGEWLAYTVAVQEPGMYGIELPVASLKRGGTFHLEIDGVDVTGPVQIPDTGAWTRLEMIRTADVRLRAGVFTMRMVMDGNGESGGVGDIDSMRFVRIR